LMKFSDLAEELKYIIEIKANFDLWYRT